MFHIWSKLIESGTILQITAGRLPSELRLTLYCHIERTMITYKIVCDVQYNWKWQQSRFQMKPEPESSRTQSFQLCITLAILHCASASLTGKKISWTLLVYYQAWQGIYVRLPVESRNSANFKLPMTCFRVDWWISSFLKTSNKENASLRPVQLCAQVRPLDDAFNDRL